MKRKPPDDSSPPQATETIRGGFGPRAIAETAAQVTRRPLGKRGFMETELIAQWPAIAGGDIGTYTRPQKITFPYGERVGGTLHLRVASGAVAAQLQHIEPLILQRINGFFGYGAVTRLTITQGPVATRPIRQPPASPRLAPEVERELEDRLAGVADPDLKAALLSLGRHLVGRQAGKK